METIPYSRQSLSDDDIQAVVDVLRSDYITQGPAIGRFEETMRRHCGTGHAVAMANGTAALHLAALALGLARGGRLWTSPNSFVASANCGLYCGATVDFVDIDPADGNMAMESLEEKLVRAEREGALPDVVVPVHFAGEPCDMARLDELRHRYGFKVIEDAAHACGASYADGRPVGCGAHSDITTFSFHPVKTMTTAEGGMALTNDAAAAERMATLRTHGILREPVPAGERPDGPWSYWMVDLGFNYRMTDLQAALGASQLSRLTRFIDRRNAIADRYDRLLADLPLRRLRRGHSGRSAVHLYVVRVDPARTARTRAEIVQALHAQGIRVQVHYIPIHTQPFYRQLGFRPGAFPEAERHYETAFSLPVFFDMTDDQQDRVVAALRGILEPGSRPE